MKKLLASLLCLALGACASVPHYKPGTPNWKPPVMADIKISQLPTTNAVTGSDVVPLVHLGVTSSISVATLGSYIGANFGGGGGGGGGSGSVTSVNVSLATCTSSGPVTSTGTVALTGCLFATIISANPVIGDCPQFATTGGELIDSGAPCAGTSTGSRTQWATVTANTTLSPTNTSVLVNAASGALTMTLPAGASDTHTYCVTKKDASANVVAVQTTGGATIQGAAAPANISFQYNGICVNSDSSGNWTF